MKKYLKFIGVGLLSFTLLVGCSDKSTKTLASIDDQKITYGDFIKEMAMYKLQLDSMVQDSNFWQQKVTADQSVSGKEVTRIEDFKDQLLESMVEDKIISKEVKNLDLKVDDAAIDANVQLLRFDR